MSQPQTTPDASHNASTNAAAPLAFAITTIAKPRERECAAAHRLAAETGYPYIPRTHRPLAKIAAVEDLDGLLVVERDDIALWIGGQSLHYHPNMAKLRVIALQQQKKDVLVDALQLAPDDRVLDCTCGLGADAIVASFAVGPTGAVRALEASPPLALLVRRGMASYTLEEPADLNEAMRRVEVARADYADYLREEATDAWDVVYFDPMFTATVEKAHGLDLVRHLARPGGPSPGDLGEARRVARRRVVMKDRRPGPELARLGFNRIQQGRRVCYGVLDAL